MPEVRRPSAARAPMMACAASGVLLALLAGAGGVIALLAGVIAQPLLALAVRGWRDARALNRAVIRRDGPWLLALWAAAVVAVGAAIAWPLSSLLETGSLGAAMALSVVAGLLLLGLWRVWPLWQVLERDGGSLPAQWRRLPDLDVGAWRGLGAAAVIAMLAGLVVVLAWPGLLGSGLHWALAVVLLVASVIAHVGLQGMTPAAELALLEQDAFEPQDTLEQDALEHGTLEHGVSDDSLVEDDPASIDAARVDEVAVDPPVPMTGTGSPGHFDRQPDTSESLRRPLVRDGVTDTALAFADGAEGVTSSMSPPVAAPGEPLEPALYGAARAGRVEFALELIQAGADPHAPPPEGDRDRRSLAVLAAVLPDLRLLRTLIAKGVELNPTNGDVTPLLAATRDSWHGRPDAVMTLLANGADARAADVEGNTPLHHAARSSDPGVVALLRDAAAEIDALNNEGVTPLGVACLAGNWRLARFLLERGARPEPVDGQPALLAAAGGDEDDSAGVQLLLKLKAKVNAVNADGRTALHEAALAGHKEIVAVLLDAGADIALADQHGSTPMHEAARGGHGEVLEQLLDHPVARERSTLDLARVDALGRNIVMLACLAEGTPAAAVQRLLAMGLDPELRDNDGKRAIDHAASAGRWSLVEVLDAAYALPASVTRQAGDDDVSTADRAPAALLREALGDGRQQGMESLAALLSATELGALLHDNDTVPEPAQVAWLLAQGADPEVRDGTGRSPMALWLRRGPAALAPINVLLARGVSPAGTAGLADFLSACLRAARSGGDAASRELESSALDLLDRGADPFAPSSAGDPPLALAVRLGWPRLLSRLLDIGVALDISDSHGMSPLHLAAALGREDMLRRLIARGASPDVLAADGQTPLGVALSAGRRDLADWLDWRGWPLPRRPLQPLDVPAAAIVGDADAVRRLLDLGMPVDAADSQGCTALLRAAGGGHRAVVDLLIARGADPRHAAQSGATALSAAVSMRHGDIVDGLLEAGAPIEQRLPGGLSVLMVACALGLPDLAGRLLAVGADIHAVDDEGRSALHCAAMFGFGSRERVRLVALLDTLLLAGGEAELEASAGGATPLLLLLGARAEPGTAADEDVLIAGLQLLLDHEARLDAQDGRGFGALHLASLHGLLALVKWLLRAGADLDLRDSLNRTPREIAVMRGFIDIAAEFTPAIPGGDVSMARLLRDQR